MEESDESSDEENELDMETLDPQSLVKDEEDQKYLDSLPELDREAILGERFEKRKNEADMKKALRESKRKEREQRRAEKGKAGKKATPKPAAKTAVTPKEEDSPSKPSASREGSTRNRDVTGSKRKVAEALANLRVSACFVLAAIDRAFY